MSPAAHDERARRPVVSDAQVLEQEIRQAHDFPTTQQTAGDLAIRLGALSLDINPMATKIDNVE